MAPQKKEEEAHVLGAEEAVLVQAFQASELSTHVVAETFNVRNMSVEDFKEDHGGQTFDFGALKEKFSNFCKDYNDVILHDSSTKGIYFCAKMLFVVGPESRKVKKDQGDKIYKFIFSYTTPKAEVDIAFEGYKKVKTRLDELNAEFKSITSKLPKGKDPDASTESKLRQNTAMRTQLSSQMADFEALVPGIGGVGYVPAPVYDNWVVNVCTYKANTYTQKTLAKVMNVSVKQASLLAMEVMVKGAYVCALKGEFLLTPLAGAIYDRDEIPTLAALYETSPAVMVGMVNASCQSGGHYLAVSDCTVACAAVYSSTRALKADLRAIMTDKLCKQYIRQGKHPNPDRWILTCNMATGGLEQKFSYAEIVKGFDIAQAASIMDTDMIESFEEYKALTPDERLEIRAVACDVKTRMIKKKRAKEKKKASKKTKKSKARSDSDTDSDSDDSDDKRGGGGEGEETAEKKEKREKREKKQEARKAKIEKERKEMPMIRSRKMQQKRTLLLFFGRNPMMPRQLQ